MLTWTQLRRASAKITIRSLFPGDGCEPEIIWDWCHEDNKMLDYGMHTVLAEVVRFLLVGSRETAAPKAKQRLSAGGYKYEHMQSCLKIYLSVEHWQPEGWQFFLPYFFGGGMHRCSRKSLQVMIAGVLLLVTCWCSDLEWDLEVTAKKKDEYSINSKAEFLNDEIERSRARSVLTLSAVFRLDFPFSIHTFTSDSSTKLGHSRKSFMASNFCNKKGTDSM